MDVKGKTPDNQRVKGFATILAIGTANPPDIMYQAEYPDFYFRVTGNEHMTEVKDKFARICKNSMVRKRHMFVTEEVTRKHPEIRSYDGLSFGIRQEMQIAANVSLAKDAALKAVEEWGQPISKITHLVFCASSGVDLPGADFQLIEVMGLPSKVKRVMLYGQGCFGGGTALRVAKDLAENNLGSRVLVVCSEITISCFRGPSKDDMSSLIGHAIFGDGAGAMIVGEDPFDPIERPVFAIVSTLETIIPNSKSAVRAYFVDAGLKYYIAQNVPSLIAENLEGILTEAFSPIGIDDWNAIFWAPHPGGRAILDSIENKLMLNDSKMRASRAVLREYGNMFGATVVFILDELRKRSAEEGKATTGEGLEWGVLFGFGPGLTVETVVLRSARMAA